MFFLILGDCRGKEINHLLLPDQNGGLTLSHVTRSLQEEESATWPVVIQVI